VGLAASLSAQACAVNPATGRRQLSLIGEDREIEMGREADRAYAAELGLYPDSALAAYVRDLGLRLAACSERPDLPWSFRLLDDPVVNAFALPGGFVFVTRGILASLNSEAELAAVIGHEIGHVTARHSVTRLSRMQLQQLGLGLGMVLSTGVRRVGDVLSSGLQLLDLKYSRGDETQADELGLRYMTRAGYDPEAMLDVFRTLALVSGEAGSRIPEWQSTHPEPENRETHIRERIAIEGRSAGGRRVRDAFLRRLDGLVYGEDPREGYFEGATFLHPTLRFAIDFPEGWTTLNRRREVVGVSARRDAALSLAPEPGASGAREVVVRFLSADGVRAGRIVEDEVNGLPAAAATFSASDGRTTIDGTVRGVVLDGSVYRIVAYAPRKAWREYRDVVARAMASFRREIDPRVLSVQPRRVAIVRLARTMTFAEFMAAYPSTVDAATLGRINRLAPADTLEAGTLVKRIVGGPEA